MSMNRLLRGAVIACVTVSLGGCVFPRYTRRVYRPIGEPTVASVQLSAKATQRMGAFSSVYWVEALAIVSPFQDSVAEGPYSITLRVRDVVHEATRIAITRAIATGPTRAIVELTPVAAKRRYRPEEGWFSMTSTKRGTECILRLEGSGKKGRAELDRLGGRVTIEVDISVETPRGIQTETGVIQLRHVK